MKSVKFKLMFICAVLLLSGCASSPYESLVSAGNGETAAVGTTAAPDTSEEYKNAASDTQAADSSAAEISETADIQTDLSEEYTGLDGTPLIIPPKDEWSSACPWDSSGEYDSGAASGIYNDGITYFLNGEAYIRFPTGYSRLASDEETNDPSGAESFGTEWKKISVGDEIGVLKAEKAYTVYSYNDRSDEFLWNDIEVQFSGEAVLDGYLVKCRPDDVMYPNEVHFIPDFDSLAENDFPMLCGSRTKEGTAHCFKLYFSEDLQICGDTTEISLNSLSASASDELAGKDYGFIRARVTLSNVKLKAWVEDVEQNRYCSAELVRIDGFMQ